MLWEGREEQNIHWLVFPSMVLQTVKVKGILVFPFYNATPPG